MPQRHEQSLTPQLKLVLVDSITQLIPSDRGAVIVTGSHGGVSVVDYVRPIEVLAVFFNDAGIGKDRAGIKALDHLESAAIAAAAYSHDSARIGDAQDGWHHGVITFVNSHAAARGVQPQMNVRDAIELIAKADQASAMASST